MSNGLNRRDFLKVAGASGAGVAAIGCSTGEVERLIPYVVPPEDIVPGVPTWYASTCRECPAGCGIHVETHSGRVTKVEGNPDNPISHGNLCARGQASVQGLYHPDRFNGPASFEEGIGYTNLAWSSAERLLADRVREARRLRPGGIVFLTANGGGSMGALTREWTAAIGGRTVVYEPWAGQPRDLDFADADVLVSFGADFLETWGSPVDYAWQFARMRTPRNGRRGKFVWVGPHRGLTGLNADEWIAPRPGTEALVAEFLAGASAPGAVAEATGVPAATLARLRDEFRGGRGVALGPGASLSGAGSERLGAAVARLNGTAAAGSAAADQAAAITALVMQMRRGEVALLLVDGPNPAYTLPRSLGFHEGFARVATRVSFSPFPDETALLSSLLLPGHHFLEAWGDYEPRPGLRELVQPAMRPVFNTKQTGDVLLSSARLLGVSIGGGATTYYDYLRGRWPGGADAWRQALKAGGSYAAAGGPASAVAQPGEVGPGALPEGASTPAAATAAGAPAGGVVSDRFAGSEAPFHLVVYPSYRFFDSRPANRPWLLELPDPVTKVSWNSWVEIHPRAARQLGVEHGDVLRVQSPFGAIDLPAFVYPGVRPDTVAVQMGLGHDAYGRFTEGVGENPNRLLGPGFDPLSGMFGSHGLRVSVTPTGEENFRAQGLFEAGVRVQHDREIARAVSLASLARLDGSGPGTIPGEHTELKMLKGYGGFAPVATDTDPTSFPPPGTEYGQYTEGQKRWGMVIDLDRCIGCSACVTACYAENNIPVVGPNEVKKGREMSWLRIERYWGVGIDDDEAYTDTATDDTRFLPMLCQHCGNAPCEPVCPVYASYHTPDGLNGQVYNRCVGTRYCANNCPYKVRYFNWFTYEFAEPLNWQLNPDVTVREKGVMEKCTFCVQRIHEAERDATQAGRAVRDGEIVPACVQTCPTEVFVFGDLADRDSDVAVAARSHRSYRVLEETNTRPAIVYLKQVTLGEPAQGGHHAPAEGAGEASGAASH
ncbi:TAT-variant-translocated molybdopterin oxidoreductase [soil metagenome]